MFERIQSEQHKLDILVNNAYAAVNYIIENIGKPFWEGDPGHGWDITNNVGLRNNYICSVYAARYTQPYRFAVNHYTLGKSFEFSNCLRLYIPLTKWLWTEFDQKLKSDKLLSTDADIIIIPQR